MRDKIKAAAAERFRAMLIVRRLSYREAAAAAGVSVGTVNAFANGKRHVSLLAAIRLANVLGCNVADFAP